MLDEAVNLVAEGGVPALTHRAVSARAGLSPALVTYHFANVGELRHSTLLHAAESLNAKLQELLATISDPKEIPEMAAELAHQMSTETRQATIVVFELGINAIRDPRLQPTFEALLNHFADLMTSPHCDAVHTRMAASALMGQIFISMASGMDTQPERYRSSTISLARHLDPEAAKQPDDSEKSC